MPGVVVQKKGPLSYIIQMKSGCQWRRHIDHMYSLDSQLSVDQQAYEEDTLSVYSDEEDVRETSDTTPESENIEVTVPATDQATTSTPSSAMSTPTTTSTDTTLTQRRYPACVRNPPSYYGWKT